MAITIQEYLSGTAAGSVTKTTAAATAGWWLVVVHGWSSGSAADMAAPTGTAGTWQLLAVADAGVGRPALRAWARQVTTAGAQAITVAAPSSGDAHVHVYVISGARGGANAEQVFELGAAASATAGTSQAVGRYAPEASGQLIGAWLAAGPINYTMPGALTARAEVDGTASTSRCGDASIAVQGAATLTATSSAAAAWAALTITVRPTGGAVTYPGTRLGVRTEIALGADPGADPAYWAGLWTDITTKVLLRDGIAITRGRGDESSTVTPTSCALTLDNTDGRFTRLNPLGPYYGRLSKNTPIRVWVDVGAGPERRATTFVSEWPPRSTAAGIDPHMPVTGSGVLRRLGQGKAVGSAIRRAVTAAQPAAYWPLEDAEGARVVASGLTGGATMNVAGSPRFQVEPRPVGSEGAVEFPDGGRMAGRVVDMPATTPGGWVVSCFLDIPAFQSSADKYLMVDWSTPAATTWVRWLLHLGTATSYSPTVPGKLYLVMVNEGGTGTPTSLVSADLRDAGPVHVVIEAVQGAGTAFTVNMYINGTLASTDATRTDTLAPITSVRMSNGDDVWIGYATTPTSPALGTICQFAATTRDRISQVLEWTPAGLGYAGETAGTRITRLSAEEGVPVAITGDPADSVAMGAQPVASYLELLRDCEAADGGVLYERRDGRLGYQVHTDRYTKPATLTLAADGEDLAPPLEPIDDDQRTRNDWTISRPGGSSAQARDDAHIAEVGLYDDQATVNVADDDQLPDQAGWRVHLGTADALRYPGVSPNPMAAPALIPDWCATDIGSVMTLTGLPADLPPGDVDLFVEGYSEQFDEYQWRATAACSPADPWTVGVLDDAVLGRIDTDGSQLAADATSGAASLSVSTTAGPLWTTAAGDCPFDIAVGGEVMTVTAISGASSPQTFTVTRSVNGVIKAHSAGADVRLAVPTILAL